MSSPVFAKKRALTSKQDPLTFESQALRIGVHWKILAVTEAMAVALTMAMHAQMSHRRVLCTAIRGKGSESLSSLPLHRGKRLFCWCITSVYVSIRHVFFEDRGCGDLKYRTEVVVMRQIVDTLTKSRLRFYEVEISHFASYSTLKRSRIRLRTKE